MCDPEIMGGIPTIRGTRIHVYDIAAWVAAGETMDDILDSYPSLSPEQVRLAALYAETNPYHGRPPQRMSIPEGATILVWDTIPMPKRS